MKTSRLRQREAVQKNNVSGGEGMQVTERNGGEGRLSKVVVVYVSSLPSSKSNLPVAQPF